MATDGGAYAADGGLGLKYQAHLPAVPEKGEGDSPGTVGSKKSSRYHGERRAPFARARMLLLVDGRKRDWLEGRGPKPTLIGAVDGANGEVVRAHLREQEDSARYLELLRETAPPRGVALIP